MLDVGTKLGKVMTMSSDFRVVHVECLWVGCRLGILKKPTNLTKFGKERTS
jgi:hypothetical protein